VLKAQVLRDVRSDPGWYAGILAHRVFATTTQQQLWPWGPLSGESMAANASDNEGYMHKYFRYTTTVEFLGVGAHVWELPIPLLMVPAALVIARAWRARRTEAAAERRGEVVLLAAIAAATLPLPVLISTASGQETQAFALTFVLAPVLLFGPIRPRA
jgi:hypothetical protein